MNADSSLPERFGTPSALPHDNLDRAQEFVVRDAVLDAQPRMLLRAPNFRLPGARLDPTGTVTKVPSAAMVDTQTLAAEALDAVRQQIHEAAHAEGLALGVTQGREAGRDEARRETAAALQVLAARTEQLDGWLTAFPIQLRQQLGLRIAHSENEMIALAHEVVVRLLGEHALKPSVVIDAIRLAIQDCCGAGMEGSVQNLLAVRVHPGDLAAVAADPVLSEWLAQQGARGVRWLPDNAVALGGCVVESTHGSLDARLETQLASLQQVLLAHRAAAAAVASTGHTA